MKIAITGGAGFIGRALVRRHRALGDEVRVLTRSPRSTGADGVQWFTGDLTAESADLQPFVDGADVLYHCAAELRQPERMADVNVRGTLRLIEAARGRIGRWVQLSSIGVYARERNTEVITETSPIAAANQYEETKAAADALVEAARSSGAFETVLLRPSIVFGPGMPNRSLAQWIAMIARRKFVFVGPPGASANYLYVDDLVEALVRCATDPAAAGGIYNLSDHAPVEAFVETIADALQIAPPKLRVPTPLMRGLAGLGSLIPGFPLTQSRIDALTSRTRFPIDRIANELGYRPVVGWAEGLRTMVRHWQEQTGSLQPAMNHAN